MRGHKVRYNEDGDGEVDENFWAQAAADQAAGRDGNDDEDASMFLCEHTQLHLLIVYFQPQVEVLYHSILSSSTTITTMVLGSTMDMTTGRVAGPPK